MKKYILQGIIIFIALIMISNSLAFHVNDSAPNSLNFKDIPISAYGLEVSRASQVEDFLNNQIKKIQKDEYNEFFNYFTESSKNKFSNSVDVFKREISENYIGKDASCEIENFGVDNTNKVYIFRIKVGLPPVATEEMLKLKAYKEKYIYLAVYDNDKDYQIEWDYNF